MNEWNIKLKETGFSDDDPIVMALDGAKASYLKARDAYKLAELANQQAIEAKELSLETNRAVNELKTEIVYLHLIPWLKQHGLTFIHEEAEPGAGYAGHLYKKCNDVAREMGYDVDGFPVGKLGKSGFLATRYPPPVLVKFREVILSRPDWKKRWFKTASWVMNVPQSKREEAKPDESNFANAVKEAKDIILKCLGVGAQSSERILDVMDRKKIPNKVWMEAKNQIGVVVKQYTDGKSKWFVWSLPKT